MAWLGEKTVGNWKPNHTERAKAKRLAPKEKRAKRPGNSDAHKLAIQKLPCCIPGCNVVGSEPHHLKHGAAAAERSVGRKASDRWLLPLCHAHHMLGVEVDAPNAKREPGWFRDHGISEPIELAAALWAVSPDAAAMTRIVLAHKMSPLPYCSKGKMK